jgi:chromosome segregation ATPase
MSDLQKKLEKISNYIEAHEDNVDALVEEIAECKSQLREVRGNDRLEIEMNLAHAENELTKLRQHLEEVKLVRKEMKLLGLTQQ